MILKLKRTPGLYLIGCTGQIKHDTGVRVAAELGWNFAEVTTPHQTSELTAHVRTVQRGRPLVIAVTRTVFFDPATFELIQENGVTVWLDSPRDADAARPAFANTDYHVDGSSGAESAARAILDLPIF